MPESCDAVVIGAGLCGLIAARVLYGAGLDVVVLEAGDDVGGRVRTDRVDGMLLDRGFQLLNPSYPQVPHTFDVRTLRLGKFEAGVVVAHGDGHYALGDPRRVPGDLGADLRVPLGSVREKLAFARWALEVGFGPAARIKGGVDEPLADRLRAKGLSGSLTDGVLRPFLAGVLAEDELRTSRRLAELLVRSFVRATPGIPAAGMQAIPEQIAAMLPVGMVRVSTAARAVHGTRVDTEDGSFEARAVVVACDAHAAAQLLDRPFSATRALTTFYHLAPESPARRKRLHIDADRRGPLVNTAVLTDAAPSYAPDRVLVSSTVLGAHDSSDMEAQVRAHAGIVYGTDTSTWEHVATYAIPHALPDTPPGTAIRRSVALGDGLFVAGDHRDTASIQGALVSGRRVAAAVLASLGRVVT